LHLVAAIFVVGPLVAGANQAARALRGGDQRALASLARLTAIYGYSSLLVGVFGAGLVQDKYGHSWSQAWLIISLVLFVLASALVIGLLVPLLRRAAAGVEGGTAGLAGRAGAIAGIASLCYLVIVVLMVYKPGR
jgi:uncharacterized membrane protein